MMRNHNMGVVLAAVMMATAFSRLAQAQTSSTPVESRGYAEAVAQSAFGNVTSQSYGGEVGFTVWKNVQVFVEFGQIRDVAPAELGLSAQQIASFIGETQSGASFTAREPATFGAAGAKYLFAIPGTKVQPYVMGGFGVAKVSKNVAFLVNGADVTAQLAQLGVVLGSDLSGDYTKPMLVVGGGVVWPIWQQLILDFQYRFNRISAEDSDPLAPASAITANRLGLGIGIKF